MSKLASDVVRTACLALAALVSAPVAEAQTPFRAGNDVTLLIGFAAGTNYDAWGRVVARHMHRHMPGAPKIVVQNMPGAGSFNAANRLFSTAPRDGSVFGIIARDAPLGPLTGAPGARFDPLKFSWIGTPTTETNVCVASRRPSVKVKRVEDLFEHELTIGSTGVGTGTYIYPKVLTGLLGLKFKQIAGFPSSSDIILAMDRGEVDGICDSLDNIVNKRPDWIADHKINLLFQSPARADRTIKGVPSIAQFAKGPADEQAITFLYAGQSIGRPFVAPPDLPAATLRMLRDAFNTTMADPEFVADVKKQQLALEPEKGEHIEALIKSIYSTPKPLIERISALTK